MLERKINKYWFMIVIEEKEKWNWKEEFREF